MDVSHAEQLIDQATNLLGPLSLETRLRLRRLMLNPSCATWDDAHTIVVNGEGLGKTLWQALLDVDPDCPTSGAAYVAGEVPPPEKTWGGYYPRPETVVEALEWAVPPRRTR